MTEERIRNAENVIREENLTEEEKRILHEEMKLWQWYKAAKEEEEAEIAEAYQRDGEEYLEDMDDFEDSEFEESINKDRGSRGDRRRSARKKNKELKKNAKIALKNFRKRTSDAETTSEHNGKRVVTAKKENNTKVKRCNKLCREAKKLNLLAD